MATGRPIMIDLREDAGRVARFLREAAGRVASRPGGRAITGVQIPYFLPGGFLEVEFFDNPGFEVMAGYDGFVGRERFDLPHWQAAQDACRDEPVEARTPAGATIRTEAPREGEWPEAWGTIVEAMGSMLVDVVASDDDPFSSLQGADPFRVGVYAVGDLAYLGEIVRSATGVSVEVATD